jgi:hypothetical protein
MNAWMLKAAESAKFEVLLTVDQGFEYEQNPRGRKIALIIFRTKSNRLRDLLPHIEACTKILTAIKPGEVVTIPKGSKA